MGVLARDESVASELIAKIRATSGLSQAELARRSSLDRSVLNAYEHRRRQPSVAALSRIAAAGGLELELARARSSAGDEHAGTVLAQVLDLAGALPHRFRADLDYPPLIRLRK
jgi:transcriptional regulator with XRE-family HTH domain